MKKIRLSNGVETLVSDCDYKYLMQWSWHFHKMKYGGYAKRRGPRPKQEHIFMHTVISRRMGLSGETDHRNQNKLDNQRRNMRKATRPQNKGNCNKQSNNTSGFKGVDWCKVFGKWRARIFVKGKGIFLGYFPGDEKGRKAAAHAYNKAALKIFGIIYLTKQG